MLKRWSSKTREHTIEVGGNIRSYVEAHPLKDNATIEYLREWIQNVQELLKNNKIHDRDNIRKYLF